MFRFKEGNNLVNISSSILKHFGVRPYHDTYAPLDDLLDANKNKKVVMFLFDAFGKSILDKYKKEAKFINKHRFKKVTSVFPPTTVACTTSLLSGLYPSETARIGWWSKYGDVVATTFSSTIFPSNQTLKPTFDEIVPFKDIATLINEVNGSEIAKIIYGFKLENTSSAKYLMEEVDKELESHNFIYAYWPKPDGTMHFYGTEGNEVRKDIIDINDSLEEFVNNHPDVLVLTIADHSMVDVESAEQPEEFMNIINKMFSVEPRAATFFVSEENKQAFIDCYNKYYKKDFELYTKEEVIEQEIFGPKETRHPYFDYFLGDFMLIAISNKYFAFQEEEILKGMHGGGTKEESILYLGIYNENN